MSADNKASLASLSSAQLAERLEKSETGRKKLRQAITILQEKLAASEKLLKANDTLQKECEQERQRAESEKKKADEEKRLRTTLEKDSATVKDQLAKVFQRLGAVENKQKADKKEVERLRNEVNLSVEGMRVAAQAVDAVQSSFQSLETNLLEKVDAAFREAHTATEAVHQLRSSFQSLENTVIKKGSLPDNQLPLSSTKPVSEKLVDEISRLFRKEKQSHCKIEQRLSKLKSVLKQVRWDNSLTSVENFDLENPALLKMNEEKVLKKRKPRGEEELLNWKARKRAKLYEADVVNSAVNRSNVDVAKDANDGQSMSSPFSNRYQMTSEEPSHVPNSASNEYIEEATVNQKGNSNGQVYLQIPSVGSKTQKEVRKSSFAQLEKLHGGFDVNKGSVKSTCLQDRGITEIRSKDVLEVMQHRTVNQLAGQREVCGRSLNAGRSTADVPARVHIDDANEASDMDINFEDSEDEWWSETLLLSPSLPDIPSPVHTSPFCLKQASFLKNDACTTDATLELDLQSSVVLEDPVSESHTPTDTPTSRINTQGAGMQHGCELIKVCIKQPEVIMQKNVVFNSSLLPSSCSRVEEQQITIESSTNCQLVHADEQTEVGGDGAQQSVKLSQDAGINASETSSGSVIASAREGQSSVHEACTSLDPNTATKIGPETFISSDSQRKEKEFQFYDEFGFEAVDSVTIAEINNFLEVLPPIAATFTNESCASDLPQVNCADAKPCEIFGPFNEVCTSVQPQAACEMPTVKVKNMKDSVVTDCSHKPCDGIGLQQVTNLSQNTNALGLPTQDKPQNCKGVRNGETQSVSGNLSKSDPGAVLISSTKLSTSTVVLLLQEFDLHGLDAELNVIAACITAIIFKGFLQATNAEKEEMQLQGTTLSRASACVPVEYLACSFISAVVDVVRLENGGEHCNTEARPIFVLVQALVAFIRSMFKDKASIILDTTFAQLGRFLVQGEAMLITLHGSIGSCQDVLSFARVFKDQKHYSHHYTEATLEDVHTGGKVLAALCQVLSCVTHLQNIVCEVLGWCDKDIMWLLTVFSSFSSICGNTAFMVEADDLLGHAICAIILELVASVEQELMKRAECSISMVTRNSASLSPNFPLGWSTLKGSLENNGIMSVEEVVLTVFKALRYILSSAHDSLGLVSQFLVDNKLAHIKEFKGYDTKPCQDADLSEEEAIKSSVPCQDVSIVCETVPRALSERQMDAARASEKWQKKYGEAVGALQLIVHFMGWDWAYNHLIIRCLWQEALSGSAQICIAVISHICSVLWRMGVQGGGTDLPGLVELKKCLIHIMQSSSLIGRAEPSLFFDQ